MTEVEEIKCFGATVASFESMKPDFYSNELYAMAILSDAQEEIARGNGEVARQFINKAKYFIRKGVHRLVRLEKGKPIYDDGEGEFTIEQVKVVK